jgi:hypothetical protein
MGASPLHTSASKWMAVSLLLVGDGFIKPPTEDCSICYLHFKCPGLVLSQVKHSRKTRTMHHCTKRTKSWQKDADECDGVEKMF